MTDTAPLVAGVELGGTKCIAALARGERIIRRAQWPTGDDPAATLGAIADWLAEADAEAVITALGVASFGPLWVDPAAPRHGRMAQTPKPGWSGVDVLSPLAAAVRCPVVLDTDVAGAALAEGRWGASMGCGTHVYLTIGTGIGGGIVVDGKPVHGALHPELGHLRIRRSADLGFAGICQAHGDCLEGLASGPAIAARTGLPAEQLGPDHPVWAHVGGEVGELLAVLILTLAPHRIVVGGGVGHGQPGLLPRIRAASARALGEYMPGYAPEALEAIIVSPDLGADAGVLGAVALALRAA